MKIFALAILATGLFCLMASAEPWLANRFSKNCAGCHNPGRTNVVPVKRRCTLSCQGCHVNPNGGGIRNFYGMWNQNMWLRSLNSKVWKQNKKLPKPYKDQPYYHKKVEKKLAKLPAKKRKAAIKKRAKKGIEAEYTSRMVSEKKFDRHNAADEHNIVKNWDKVMLRIPRDDPYRLRRERIITAGGDFRFFNWSQTRKLTDSSGTTVESKDSRSIPMAFDIGMRVMPVNKFSFVTEARFQNSPSASSSVFDRQFDTAIARSAYFMVDDLWYNTYFIKGIYRPLFGYYNIDHNSLSTKLTGLNYAYRANATSIGGSPNVPFFQIHLLEPTNGGISKDKGTVLNLGGRFITLGASFMLSTWNTTNDVQKTKRDMTSFTFGFSEWDVTANADLVQYELTNTQSKDKGFYWLLDLKYRFWKEFYATLTKASANTSTSAQEGSSDDMSLGVRGFLLNGLELEILMVTRNDQPKGKTKVQDNALQTQFHWFF